MRYLFLWRRWLGIGLCLFMALWFISGIVMLFIGYPKLTPAEALARLPVLSADAHYIDVNQAILSAAQDEAPEAISLSSIAGRPYYLFAFPEQAIMAVDALTGKRVQHVDNNLALASARAFYDESEPELLALVELDAWTQSRALDKDRPLYKVAIDDEDSRLLYISSQSGRVVRDVTFEERSWGWIGAWLHWIYPFRNLPWWGSLVIYLSLAATVMSVLGQYLGLKRWRFAKTYRNGSHSPYSTGFSRWHHIGGMVFGVLLIAWIFSGLISMRPWGLFGNESKIDLQPFYGDTLADIDPNVSVAQLIHGFQQSGISPRELVWHKVNDTVWVTAYDDKLLSRTMRLSQPETVLDAIPVNTLQKAIENISADNAVTTTTLQEYDFYYLAREQQSMYGHQLRPLPILRVQFDDPEKTWLHIDRASGKIIEVLDNNRRLSRWLFNLLHSWDWQPLLQRPVLREILMTAMSLGGLVICVSGIVVGWRRLKRQGKKKASRKGVKPT